MDKDIKYIQFPISLLPEIFNDKQAFFDRVLSIGACYLADNLEAQPVEVAKQLIYHFITDPKRMLTKSLYEFIEGVNGITIEGQQFHIDEDRQYYFLQPHEFNCNGTDVLLSMILLENPEVFGYASFLYKHLKACKYLNINVLNISSILKQIESIDTQPQPLCMVNLSIVWDYYSNNKSDEQLTQFAAYAAIRSILGKRDYLLTNKNHIIARMFGASSIKTLPENKHPLLDKYMKRYQQDKLIEQLELDWHLKAVNVRGLHGIYVSFKLDHVQLTRFAESRMLKYKRAELKAIKAAARNQT